MHNGYSPEAFQDDLSEVIEMARAKIPIEYDTMIGTGLSGALVIPTLARALGKYWAIVRKPGESTHSWRTVEGKIGNRWIFVDDMVASGKTRDRVIEAVENITSKEKYATQYLGTFLYHESPYWISATWY
jgi:adenine/guanine phosphoribosyltransferase-like PRPP-binding protein